MFNQIKCSMKKLLFLIIASGVIVFSSCEKPDAGYELKDDASVELKSSHAGKGHHLLNFRANLSGDQEVPPADTRARGQAIFQLSKDGTEISYKLIVANIQNVTQAHIHLAPVGVNGPVVVWLYPSAPPAQLIPGRFNGVLAEGVITDASLVGPLLGNELSVLIDALISGNAYVNVHTSQFPPGEIRGQIWGNDPGN
jgi:hypothetical protein